MSTSNLNGIQFMSRTQYNALGTKDTGTVYFVEAPTVIETYINGASWYRVWSDGWIEQGGIIDSLADSWTLTFLKQFTTSTYTLQGEQWGGDATGNLGITSQTTTSASGNHIGASVIKVSWYACGY